MQKISICLSLQKCNDIFTLQRIPKDLSGLQWILSSGFWVDTKTWVDTANWID